MHGVRSSAAHLPEEDMRAMRAGKYGMAIALMREMHWGWADLLAAPFDLVQELAVRLEAEAHWLDEKRTRDNALRG